jgi:hypothetical protein
MLADNFTNEKTECEKSKELYSLYPEKESKVNINSLVYISEDPINLYTGNAADAAERILTQSDRNADDQSRENAWIRVAYDVIRLAKKDLKNCYVNSTSEYNEDNFLRAIGELNSALDCLPDHPDEDQE